MKLLLFFLVFCSTILGVIGQGNFQCGRCVEILNKLLKFEKNKLCIRKCRKEQKKRGELVPFCKRKCCKKLCKAKQNAFNVCMKTGYCVATESPSETPTTPTKDSSTEAPATSPTDTGPSVGCDVKLSCLTCLSAGCFYGEGGGAGACSECKPLKDTCGWGSTGLCNKYPKNAEGSTACIDMIVNDCTLC